MHNYSELIEVLPELEDYVNEGKLDYSNLKAVRLLNKALFMKEMRLKLHFPEGHLCPTFHNRLEYIKKIEFLLKYVFKLNLDSKIIGIDIGTGASCVYPLIGCARNENWEFLATDVDDEILEYASCNLESNSKQIADRIKLIKNSDPLTIFPEQLIAALESQGKVPKFALCNPPFYEDATDLESRRLSKRLKPTLESWEMSKTEMSTDLGGEFEFVRKMIDESTKFTSENVLLFSCMLGLKETLKSVLSYLKDKIAIKSFAFEKLQIKYTCRYLIFWSFTDLINRNYQTCRLAMSAKAKRIQSIDDIDFNFADLVSKIAENYCDEIYESDEEWFFELEFNKWSRKYRRNPENATPLQHPLKISVKLSEKLIEFELLNDEIENEDWDTFVGFINHLRKELK